MTAWIGLPATEDTDWTDYDFRLQFAKAIHERGVAVGYDTYLPSSAEYEDNIDAIGGNDYGIRALQGYLEDISSGSFFGHKCNYVRPSSLTGLSSTAQRLTGGFWIFYRRSWWWSDIGVPAAGIPSEDLECAYSPSGVGNKYDGVRVAVLNGAYGSFAGHDGEIAIASQESDGSFSWSFETPADGTLIAELGVGYISGWFYYHYGYRVRNADTSDWEITSAFGWTRKRPLTISRLTDDGSLGQRAVLIPSTSALNRTYTRYAGVLSEAPSHPITNATYGVRADVASDDTWGGHGGDLATWDGSSWSYSTPSAGSVHAFHAKRITGFIIPLRNASIWMRESDGDWYECGKVYEHNGTSWVLSDDQETPPDTETLHGPAEEGDYIGPWIWNELQSAIQALHVQIGYGGIWNSYAADGTQKGVSVTGEPTWTDAKSQAESDWTSGGPPSGWNGGGLSVYTSGAYSAGGPTYHAWLERVHSTIEMKFEEGDTSWNCKIESYVILQKPNVGDVRTFNNMGDSSGSEASSFIWDSTITKCQSVHQSPLWASTRTNTVPSPWCTTPVVSGVLYAEGYYCSVAWLTRDLKVPGGFEYQ